MSATTAPSVHCEQLHPTLSVEDVSAAVGFYTGQLGFRLGFLWGDPPTTAGVDLGKVQVMLSQGTSNPDGWSVYFVVEDVDELHAFHRDRGVDIVDAPEDKPWGLRQYRIRDPFGHALFFGQHLPATEPKLEIERVEVPVRLERRLAAALADLAAHKGMSVSECLEETLMHTFERTPDGGVPSPHSQRTLDHIEELKRKHGIDYDTHATYRFVEKAASD